MRNVFSMDDEFLFCELVLFLLVVLVTGSMHMQYDLDLFEIQLLTLGAKSYFLFDLVR